jgi:hypothetical protein
MTFQTKIQAYLSSHVLESGHNVQCAVDWTGGVLYTIGQPSGTTYIAKFDLNSGVELAWQGQTAYSPKIPFHEWPIGFDANGVYFTGNDFTTFIKANASDLSQNVQSAISFNTAFPQGTFSPITDTGGGKWMLCTGIGQLTSSLEVFICINTSTLATWTPGILSYGNRIACGCAGQYGTGIGYIASTPEQSDPSGSLKFIQVNVNSGTQGATTLSTIAASTIDAGWTVIGQTGMCLDQTDNNLLVFVQGQVGATNQYYIIKLNATTGALIWKLACPGPGGGPQTQQSVIKSQKYVLLYGVSGGANGIVIDTSTGTITTTITTGLVGLIPSGALSQSFNDQSGAIFGEYGYTNMGQPQSPLPLNSTPNSSDGWAAVYVIQPANPSPSTGTHASYVRIWGNMPR